MAHSKAIWINNNNNNRSRSTSDGGGVDELNYWPSAGGAGRYTRSLSVNSDGTTVNSPPPYSSASAFFTEKFSPSDPMMMNNNEQNYLQRFRTSSFGSSRTMQRRDSGDYGSNGGNGNESMSTSAPGRGGFEQSYRRSNSISTAADKNLGVIDEFGKIYNFGSALKRSMGKLFDAPKGAGGKYNNNNNNYDDSVFTSDHLGTSPFSSKKQQYNNHGKMTDQVVSMLCEGALR